MKRAHASDIDLDGAWRDAAACRGLDPALWYPETGDTATVKTAKAVCAACPVVDQCRAHALAIGDDHGIWGGLTVGERRRLRRGNPTDPRPCRVDGCDQRASCQGLCHTHYVRWWRTGVAA